MKSRKEAGRFAAILSRAFRRQPIPPRPFRHRHFAAVIPPLGHSKGEVRLGLSTPTASALTNSASVIASWTSPPPKHRLNLGKALAKRMVQRSHTHVTLHCGSKITRVTGWARECTQGRSAERRDRKRSKRSLSNRLPEETDRLIAVFQVSNF